MKLATRKRVTSRLWSYRLLNGDRIDFSPDRRVVHIPLTRFCLFIPSLSNYACPLLPKHP